MAATEAGSHIDVSENEKVKFVLVYSAVHIAMVFAFSASIIIGQMSVVLGGLGIVVYVLGLRHGVGFSLPSLEIEYFLPHRAYYHRSEVFLKDRYLHYVQEKGRTRNEEVCIDFVSLTDVFVCARIKDVLELSDHHIWSHAYIASKFNCRTDEPVKVLCVGAHHLDAPITMHSMDSTGCKSWVEFNPSLHVKLGEPVLRDDEYARQIHEVKSLLGIQQYLQDGGLANSG